MKYFLICLVLCGCDAADSLTSSGKGAVQDFSDLIFPPGECTTSYDYKVLPDTVLVDTVRSCQ